MKKYIYLVLTLLLVLPLNSIKAASTSTPVDSLIKGSLSTIYYYAADGNRYVFPNDKTFGSWFGDFENVKTITDEELAKIPLKGNVTYRPGVRMVKIQTVPKVYAVDEGGKLRWVESEDLAKKLYGEDWNKKIDDISDAFFVNYKEGASIKKVEDYSPTTVIGEVKTINKEKGITEGASTPQATTTVGSSTSVVAKSGYSATPNSAEEAAPNISEVKLSTITSSTAQISWYTNKFSDSQIQYSLWPLSTAASSSILTARKDESVKDHLINLTKLAASGTYYFKAISTDKQSRTGESLEYIFKTTLNGTTVTTPTTPGGTTPAAPASGAKIVICHIPPDDPANKQTITIDQSALSAHLAHGDTTGACPGADTTPPVISGIAVSSLSTNSATISWNTNESASGTVFYGLASSYGSSSASTQTGSGTLYAHTVNLSGLTLGTLYHYKVRAVDSSGNASESSDATFTTSGGGRTCADLTVTDIEFTPASPAVGDSVARVSKVKNLGNIASPVVNIKGYVDDVLVAYGSFGPLQPGATIADYSHNVQWGGNWTAIAGIHKFEFFIDADNHVAECDETNNRLVKYLTVADTTPPVISNLAAAATQTVATITWTTDESATSEVEYGLTSSYGNTAASTTLITSHSIVFSGLQAGTTYYYRVKSTDAAGNTVTSAGQSFTTLSLPSFPPPSNFLLKFSSPTNSEKKEIAIDANNTVYVSEWESGGYPIKKYTNDGIFLSELALQNSPDGKLRQDVDIAIDKRNNNIYIADVVNSRIQKFTSTGTLIATWGSVGSGDTQFNYPNSVVVDKDGNVYVSDTNNVCIKKFASDGTFITKWGSRGAGDSQFLDRPGDVAVDNDGNVYVVDPNAHLIKKFTSNGVFVTKWTAYAGHIAADSRNNIYATDGYNYKVQAFTSNGTLITEWGSQITMSDRNILGYTPDGYYLQWNGPYDVVVDSNNNIYTSDTNRVQKFSAIP